MERRASVSLWPACPVTVSQRRVAIEVAGLAVWAAALPLNKLTDEQVPLSLSASVRVERWNRAPSAQDADIGPIDSFDDYCPAWGFHHFSIFDHQDTSVWALWNT